MTTTTDERQAVHTLHFGPGRSPALVRALRNCVLFASTDVAFPMLMAVLVEFDGTELRLASTDRTRLCAETVEHGWGSENGAPEGHDAPAAPFSVLLSRNDAKAAADLLNANRFDPVRLVVDTSRGSGDTRITVELLATSVSYRALDGTFPAYGRLIPEGDRTAVDTIGFNAKHLADLARVQTDQKINSVRIATYGERRPTRIDYRDGPTVLLMPYKIDPEAEWGAASL